MTPLCLKGKMHLLPILPGPLIIEHLVEDGVGERVGGAHFFSSELSPQSFLPSHLLEDEIHFLELAHFNSVEEHCTEIEGKGYMH